MSLASPAAPRFDAGSFEHPIRGIETVETHLSWVILTGDYAYKIKKPVRFEFIDATTLESRRMLCEAELALNRRLAPDLYLDVVPLRQSGDSLRCFGSGAVVDYAVRMVQFDRSQELSALLVAGDVRAAEIAGLAELLADFHASEPAVEPAAAEGDPAQVRRLVLHNADELIALCDAAAAARVSELRAWFDARVAALQPLLAARKAAGRVREGHGDLHARNILRWRGRLTPFDRLEFDPALRRGDVALDLAFLYMDLESKGRADLAAVLLDRYCSHSGDYELLQVLAVYAVHRALVRAKIDALQLHGAVRPELRAAAATQFAARLDTATRLASPGKPVLMLMHGVSGSGKSWLSAAAVPVLPAIRVRSDVERRRVLGLQRDAATNSPVGGGAYAGDVTDQTDRRLLDCARHGLSAQHHVIVDATFLDPERRRPFFTLAADLGCRVLIIACSAPRAELQRRIAARAAAGNDPSEANAGVLARQLQQEHPLLPFERAHTLELDTAGVTEPGQLLPQLTAALTSRWT
jgi:aminoglycoside phosphotransferase family enzyme/predicted kinase